jgi:cell wall-associated NlpC family hydrolase
MVDHCLGQAVPLAALLALAGWLAAMAGCAPAPQDAQPIGDLVRIKQDCAAWIDPATAATPIIAPARQQELARQYRRALSAPWQPDFVLRPVGEVRAWFDHHVAAGGYGEALQPVGKAWVEALARQAGLDSYPNCRRRAITVRNTFLRQLPTVRPLFASPKPGEAYPFDQLQESAVWAGTPILVAHVAADGGWVWAQTPFADGWMPAADLGFVDDATAAAWQAAPLAAVVADSVPVRDEAGTFLFHAHVGAAFPIAAAATAPTGATSPAAGGLEVLVPVRRADGSAALLRVRLPAGSAAAFPLPATPANLAAVANRMLGQPYGWGGLYEDRDCSATLRDLLAPFGLWLPRNSADQARAGAVVPLAGLSPQDKQSLVLRQAVPWLTLLYRPGHIMLYIGHDGGTPLVFQNAWAIKARLPDGTEGRKIIGCCCITTLAPGLELPEVRAADGDQRKQLQSMIFLPPAAAAPAAPAPAGPEGRP